jgi:hypothetical protein
MSEGYRAALAMLVDMVRQLTIAYEPEELVHDADGRSVVPLPGVVLIDEMDAHLHPAWQREIGFWLKARFPRMQFIVTTHSALVCQAADENGIFRLPAPGTGKRPERLTPEEYWQVIASRPDEILRGPAARRRGARSLCQAACQGAKSGLVAFGPQELQRLLPFVDNGEFVAGG